MPTPRFRSWSGDSPEMKGAVRLAALIWAATVCLAASEPRSAYNWHLPPGVAAPPVPADNPMSAEKVELGRRLFYDADLSIDGTIACATCHEQHRAFTEGNATHPGVRDSRGRRNVMALANVGYFSPLTWANPALTSLELQVWIPVLGVHPVEMGMTGNEKMLAERLGGDACYRRMFAAAFPKEDGRISLPTIAKAIAAFERTMISADSAYDRYRRGARRAISPVAERGEALFRGKAACATCHSGPDFTDLRYHDIGTATADRGLMEETHNPSDDGKFRTPSLRNVSLTGPYMHDGSVKDLLMAVQEHFLDRPGSELPARDLSQDDLADLVAFLDSLTDRSFVTDPRFALPKTACGKKL